MSCVLKLNLVFEFTMCSTSSQLWQYMQWLSFHLMLMTRSLMSEYQRRIQDQDCITRIYFDFSQYAKCLQFVFYSLLYYKSLGYVCVDYMPEVTRKSNNKTTFIIFKNTALHLKYAIWLVELMMQYANTKFTWTCSITGSYQILYAIV